MIRLVLSKMILILWCLPSPGQEQLEIEGAIVLKDGSSTPARGTIRFNSGTNDFEGWNGLYWASLTRKRFTFGGGVTDIDGNEYQSVIIGSQEWMAENLRTSKYRDGTVLVYFAGDALWATASFGAWCWYNNDAGLDDPYGKLYNWYAVDDARGLCPTGWNMPTDAEWTTLINYLGGTSVAGAMMKEPGLKHWRWPNEGATNDSGFTGTPGGFRTTSGNYLRGVEGGYYWSKSRAGGNPRYYYMFYSNERLNDATTEDNYGLSVRCIKDEN